MSELEHLELKIEAMMQALAGIQGYTLEEDEPYCTYKAVPIDKPEDKVKYKYRSLGGGIDDWRDCDKSSYECFRSAPEIYDTIMSDLPGEPDINQVSDQMLAYVNEPLVAQQAKRIAELEAEIKEPEEKKFLGAFMGKELYASSGDYDDIREVLDFLVSENKELRGSDE